MIASAPCVIGISYTEGVPDELIDAFADELSAEGVAVVREARPDAQMFASMEWLMPTAIFVFFTKSYLEGFLQAAGAQHFEKVQSSLRKFLKTMSLIRVTYFASGKKLRADNPFTGAISLVADGREGRGFKLLFRKDADEIELAKSIEAFLMFLRAFHAEEDVSDLIDDFGSVRPVGGLHLVCYDGQSGKLREVNARA